ncbi:MAG: hypothetical protein IPK65_14515 [Gammaproteobacteria bacterium]|nr:hypothetical protein [Gammaproteobacteria bacterium]
MARGALNDLAAYPAVLAAIAFPWRGHDWPQVRAEVTARSAGDSTRLRTDRPSALLYRRTATTCRWR